MHQARFPIIVTTARAFAFGAMVLGGAEVAAAPANPSGLWSTKDDESIIEIAPCGTFFCGTLVWLKEPNEADGTAKLDSQNGDKQLRTRPMLGLVLLIDLAPEKSYWRGKAYNPEDGKTYEITFKPTPGKVPSEKAEIEGCILKILCSSETFTRVQTIPGAASSPTPAAPTKPQPTQKTPAARP